jgi:hypothetical protein
VKPRLQAPRRRGSKRRKLVVAPTTGTSPTVLLPREKWRRCMINYARGLSSLSAESCRGTNDRDVAQRAATKREATPIHAFTLEDHLYGKKDVCAETMPDWEPCQWTARMLRRE